MVAEELRRSPMSGAGFGRLAGYAPRQSVCSASSRRTTSRRSNGARRRTFCIFRRSYCCSRSSSRRSSIRSTSRCERLPYLHFNRAALSDTALSDRASSGWSRNTPSSSCASPSSSCAPCPPCANCISTLTIRGKSTLDATFGWRAESSSSPSPSIVVSRRSVRMGQHVWLLLATIVTELLVITKWSKDQFPAPFPPMVKAGWALGLTLLVLYPTVQASYYYREIFCGSVCFSDAIFFLCSRFPAMIDFYRLVWDSKCATLHPETSEEGKVEELLKHPFCANLRWDACYLSNYGKICHTVG